MGHHKKKPKPTTSNLTTKEKLRQIKKEKKQKLKEKRARLVVRNLPFETTEENLRQHFEKFGEVDSVEILKKEDGLLVGCGFVQFKLVQKAAKARYHTNNKEFLGRKINVDFALAKNKYEQVKESEKEVKKECDEIEIKQEPLDDDEVKNELHSDNDDKPEVIEDIKEEDENSDDSSNSEEEEGDDDDDDDEVKDEAEIPQKRPRVESNDVNEGKTVFIKNVPFSATNEDLKECMQQFGPIYYALICIDKYTEHSKGTAFVKFHYKEDAEKALNAGTELTLLGNVLDCHKALGRNEVQQKSVAKKEEKSAPKDSRNLYLVKEGVILAGSPAAVGVSASDMAKRLQLEQYKTQMLRNLNMFVSRDRLIIHNLPPNWDDRKLRALFAKHSAKSAVIKEARIMRDMKNVDANGIGVSKEYGFVSFTRHEDALAALRSLNNNPNIFTPARRPIVAFSIENKSMLKAKAKRLEKSRLKNPKCKDFNPELAQESKTNKIEASVDDSNREKFAGIAAKPGVQKMRSRYKLQTQARVHAEMLKKEKHKKKFAKKNLQQKKGEFTKQPKQKINKKKRGDDDNFGKLVANYKKQLMGKAPVEKTKWYET